MPGLADLDEQVGQLRGLLEVAFLGAPQVEDEGRLAAFEAGHDALLELGDEPGREPPDPQDRGLSRRLLEEERLGKEPGPPHLEVERVVAPQDPELDRRVVPPQQEELDLGQAHAQRVLAGHGAQDVAPLDPGLFGRGPWEHGHDLGKGGGVLQDGDPRFRFAPGPGLEGLGQGSREIGRERVERIDQAAVGPLGRRQRVADLEVVVTDVPHEGVEEVEALARLGAPAPARKDARLEDEEQGGGQEGRPEEPAVSRDLGHGGADIHSITSASAIARDRGPWSCSAARSRGTPP